MGSFSILCILSLILIVSCSNITNAQDSPADYLKPHNAARSAIEGFNIPNLVWDNKIAAFAQNYANQRKDCKVIPSGGNGGHYGENLAISNGYISGAEAVKLWVDEQPHFDHYHNKCIDGECLHYTQVIWNDSLRVGCGKVKCDNGGTFITCNYYPPGNIPGQEPF
ncbi:basic form of pathogenesis-related protein 1-like [Lathyrus oleraceus]|uniref:basic form of pathogenesis-related protein 1-like n=1 Tax=Pisum sativum TaxID=3888 RepID=UPI0021D05BDC|nr:basic form of pathogenesis-related protein 1-like [Pisum sativum]